MKRKSGGYIEGIPIAGGAVDLRNWVCVENTERGQTVPLDDAALLNLETLSLVQIDGLPDEWHARLFASALLP